MQQQLQTSLHGKVISTPLHQDPPTNLTAFRLSSYRGKKHLSYPPSGASYEEIDDIGEVMDESDDLDSNDTPVEDVKVIGVYQLERVYSCINCKKGTIEVSKNQQLGTCKLCKMAQVPRLGMLTAKFFLETFNCKSHVTVRAYEDMLNAIVQAQEITSANLIKSPRFDAKYNECADQCIQKVMLASRLPITFTNHLQTV